MFLEHSLKWFSLSYVDFILLTGEKKSERREREEGKECLLVSLALSAKLVSSWAFLALCSHLTKAKEPRPRKVQGVFPPSNHSWRTHGKSLNEEQDSTEAERTVSQWTRQSRCGVVFPPAKRWERASQVGLLPLRLLMMLTNMLGNLCDAKGQSKATQH